MLRKAAAVMLILGLAATGCATVEIGKKFEAAAAERIQIGTSTEADVLALLGAPLKMKVNPDGTKKYGYAHIRSMAYPTSPWTMKGEGKGDRLIIEFDAQGVVRGMERSSM